MDSLFAKGIVLREFVPADAEQFVAAIQESAETVGRWLPWWKADYSAHEALLWFAACEQAIASHSGFNIGVFHEDTGLLIGSVAINRIDAENRVGSLGYWVRESQQGNGHCSEAVNRIIDFGFQELALARLEAVILAKNHASRRVVEKCGAILECIAENRLLHEGEPTAAAIYSLIPDRKS